MCCQGAWSGPHVSRVVPPKGSELKAVKLSQKRFKEGEVVLGRRVGEDSAVDVDWKKYPFAQNAFKAPPAQLN